MIIWLASYPKSGNTWVRNFLSTLFFENSPVQDFSNLKKITTYPRRTQFSKFTSEFNNLSEVSKYWIKTQNLINKERKVIFLKTHNAFCKINNLYNFSNKKNTIGTIYIVRDPRNVLTSLKNHNSHENYDITKKMIVNDSFVIGHDNEDKSINRFNDNKIATFISSWSNHYRSWKNSSNNLIIVKYEDLLKDPVIYFGRIKEYLEKILNIKIQYKKFLNAIDESEFLKLKDKEKIMGFEESPFNKNKKKVVFFNLGPNNNWKKILDYKTADYIKSKFENEMKELDYI